MRTWNMKNITLSADEHLIALAREKAQKHKSTLNALFREWLKQYVKGSSSSIEYMELMKKLAYVDAGKQFTRDEYNER